MHHCQTEFRYSHQILCFKNFLKIYPLTAVLVSVLKSSSMKTMDSECSVL